jgi:hypothetical protein
MKNPKLLALATVFAFAGAGSAALAQQAGSQEMDHSQHMMQGAPAAQAPQNPGGMRMGPGGKQPGGKRGGAMGGMDHDMGGGMGCGMMGSGMGGGMMGGMGGGMMGGMGRGMGGMGGRMSVPLGVTGPLSHLDLAPDQSKQILKIQDDLRKKHYDTRGKMIDIEVRIRDLHLADKRDASAIVAEYRKLGELRGQMVAASLEAQDKIEAVLTKEQKDVLRRHHPMWMMEDR